jgi:uroporphyrinogen-III synthase
LPAALEGLRVALLETHLSEEAAAHVRRFGGIPYSVAAVRERVHRDRVGPFIQRLASGGLSGVVFMTGVGARVLLEEATRIGQLEETISALQQTTIACRGPKPAAILKTYDVPVRIAAAEPFTTRQVLDALASVDFRGKAVAIIHQGEPSGTLATALAARGAVPEQLSLYESTLPDDLEPLKLLVRELIEGRVDAIAFTNRIQCRHLFRVAVELGLAVGLADALNADVIVAAVGPVCAEALQSVGVAADVIPARPKMESMIEALAEYFELTHGLSDEAGMDRR